MGSGAGVAPWSVIELRPVDAVVPGNFFSLWIPFLFFFLFFSFPSCSWVALRHWVEDFATLLISQMLFSSPFLFPFCRSGVALAPYGSNPHPNPILHGFNPWQPTNQPKCRVQIFVLGMSVRKSSAGRYVINSWDEEMCALLY